MTPSRQRLTIPSLLVSLLVSAAMLLLRGTGSAAFLLAGGGRPRAAATAAAAVGGGWLSGGARRGVASASTGNPIYLLPVCVCMCVPACRVMTWKGLRELG